MTVALGPNSEEPHEVRVLGGRWELLSELARGGMGVLYVGRHLQTGRRAAVKVIEYASAEALARFRLEASVCAQINHPGIVDVFDADLDEPTSSCFIAMELLEGCTLRNVMDDSSSTPEQVIELLMAALEPLGAAHTKGFVHRDLKPENLFVLSEPRAGTRVKLLDFGIVAQKSDDRLTRIGTAMGTPHYMSPEQATSAREAGPSSDIWSMGVMLYEAVHGDVPFTAETSHGVIVQACTCPHMPLDQVALGVDPAIARLVDRCLAKPAGERPANAQALLDELRGLLRANSLPAARPSLRTRSLAPKPAPAEPHPEQNLSGVRPSMRTRSVVNAAHLLAASGVVCSLSALALPFVGLAAPGTALFCAAIGGGLLYTASTRMRALRELIQPPANQNALRVPATVALSERPKRILHPMRGVTSAPVRIEMYGDLTCAITRRAFQKVMNLRLDHPDEISVVWKPYWDPQRELAPVAAEIARSLFEREGSEIFWAFFDRMLANTRRVTSDLLLEHAANVCPDNYGFQRALRAHVHRRSLQQCREEAESVGIDESPTFVINGNLIAGDPNEDRLHWAYVDAKSGLERKRSVELGATFAGESPLEQLKAARGFLIRYQGARNAPGALRRTREQARERAEKLTSRAKMEGADFADVALRFSDGLLESEQILPRLVDPLFQDAVASLRIGDMSAPIECDEGFQVVQRLL